MDLTEYFVIFAMLWKTIPVSSSSSTGLHCYKCEAAPVTHKVDEPMCQHFDYSEKYVTECATSSMCYKRITTTQFGTKIYERGCAMQILKDYQELRNGKWEWVKKINEVYAEDCVESPGDIERVTRTEHCHCRGDLCNGGVELRTCVSLVGFMVGLLVLR